MQQITLIFKTFMAFSFFLLINVAQGEFEDNRCRCVCPDVSIGNGTINDYSRDRRYYTSAKTTKEQCSADGLVKPELQTNGVFFPNDGERKAFLSRCECKYTTRNTTMLKVVVIFVIFVLCTLVAYMLFLLCLDPMIRQKRSGFRYQEQNNEVDDNIFNAPEDVSEAVSSSVADGGVIRPRAPSNTVLDRVEQKQSSWMRKVQLQRKSIFDDHTMLN